MAEWAEARAKAFEEDLALLVHNPSAAGQLGAILERRCDDPAVCAGLMAREGVAMAFARLLERVEDEQVLLPVLGALARLTAANGGLAAGRDALVPADGWLRDNVRAVLAHAPLLEAISAVCARCIGLRGADFLRHADLLARGLQLLTRLSHGERELEPRRHGRGRGRGCAGRASECGSGVADAHADAQADAHSEGLPGLEVARPVHDATRAVLKQLHERIAGLRARRMPEQLGDIALRGTELLLAARPPGMAPPYLGLGPGVVASGCLQCVELWLAQQGGAKRRGELREAWPALVPSLLGGQLCPRSRALLRQVVDPEADAQLLVELLVGRYLRIPPAALDAVLRGPLPPLFEVAELAPDDEACRHVARVAAAVAPPPRLPPQAPGLRKPGPAGPRARRTAASATRMLARDPGDGVGSRQRLLRVREDAPPERIEPLDEALIDLLRPALASVVAARRALVVVAGDAARGAAQTRAAEAMATAT